MSAALTYAFWNEAHANELSTDVLAKLCADTQDAYDIVFATKWGVLPAQVTVTNDPCVARVLHLVDTIPEAPDALAYHTVDDRGRPVLRLGVETIRSFLAGDQTLVGEVSKAASHEIFETAVNPWVRYYVFVDGKSAMLAKEVCDPVQGTSWQRSPDAMPMSNFVLPSYFDAGDTDGPYDFLNTLSAPLSVAPNGYLAWSDGTSTFGEHVPDWKKRDVRMGGRHMADFVARVHP